MEGITHEHAGQKVVRCPRGILFVPLTEQGVNMGGRPGDPKDAIPESADRSMTSHDLDRPSDVDSRGVHVLHAPAVAVRIAEEDRDSGVTPREGGPSRMAYFGRCRGPVRVDASFERRVGQAVRNLRHDLAQIRGASPFDDGKPTPWGGHSLHKNSNPERATA
jgi:hypothetical protein